MRVSEQIEGVNRVKFEVMAELRNLAKSKDFVSTVQKGFLRWFVAYCQLTKDRDEQNSRAKDLEERYYGLLTGMVDAPEVKAEVDKLELQLREVTDSCCDLQLQVEKRSRLFRFEFIEDPTSDEMCVLAACLHLLLSGSEKMLPRVSEDGPYHAGHQLFMLSLSDHPAPDLFDVPEFGQSAWLLDLVRELPCLLGLPALVDSDAANCGADDESTPSPDPFSPDEAYFTWNGVQHRLTPTWYSIIKFLHRHRVWGNKSMKEEHIQRAVGCESAIRCLFGNHKHLKEIVVRPTDENGKVKQAMWQLVAPRTPAKLTR